MDEQRIRQIIREELAGLLRTDRYTFQKLIQIFDGQNIMVGTSNGTKIGTAATQKIAFFGGTPVVQPNDTGETSLASAGAGSTLKVDSTSNGGLGGTAYTFTDIVKGLKQLSIFE